MDMTQMSIQAAVMIAFIVIVRALGMGRLPKWSFEALWGLTLARLLLPVSIESPLSVYGAIASVRSALAKWAAASEPAAAMPLVEAAAQTTVLPVMEAQTLVEEIASPALTLSPWLIAWLAGALCLAGFFLVTHIRCRRVYACALPHGALRARGTAVPVRICDQVTAPLTYGVLKPVILLPKALSLSGGEQRYVLAHELMHIRRWDALKKWLLALTLCVHWFNPLVWVMFVLADRDMELSCDEAALRSLGGDARVSYATMLIDLMERRGGMMPVANHFSRNAVEERIKSIMKHSKTSLISVVVAIALLMTTGAALATSAGKTGYVADDGFPVVEEAQGGGLARGGYSAADGADDYPVTEAKEQETVGTGAARYSAADDGADYPVTESKGPEATGLARGGYSAAVGAVDYAGTEATSSGDSVRGIDPDIYAPYEPYGLSYDASDGRLYYEGELVRFFEDMYDIGDGISSGILSQSADGTAYVHAVRDFSSRLILEDGSLDPAGRLIGLARYTEAEVQARMKKLSEGAFLSEDRIGAVDESWTPEAIKARSEGLGRAQADFAKAQEDFAKAQDDLSKAQEKVGSAQAHASATDADIFMGQLPEAPEISPVEELPNTEPLEDHVGNAFIPEPVGPPEDLSVPSIVMESAEAAEIYLSQSGCSFSTSKDGKYHATVVLPDGQKYAFGPLDSAAKLYLSIIRFMDDSVLEGVLTQAQADAIMMPLESRLSM